MALNPYVIENTASGERTYDVFSKTSEKIELLFLVLQSLTK